MNTKTTFCPLTVSLFLGTAIITAALGAEAPEEKPYPEWDRGSVRVGGFAAAFDSSVGFGVGGSSGVNIDAEKLLGLDTHLTVFRVDALYRAGESRRHRLDFTYTSMHRSADKTLTQQIDIDGTTLLPGTEINSVFNFDLYRFSYTYSFFKDERVNLGAGLGIYVAPVKYGLDITTPGDNRSLDTRNVTLPLPALSLRGDVKITRKLSLYGELDAMYLELGDFSGSLADMRVGLEYQFTKNFGMGLGYNSFNLGVDSTTSSDYPNVDFSGSVNMRFSGLLLYGKLSF